MSNLKDLSLAVSTGICLAQRRLGKRTYSVRGTCYYFWLILLTLGFGSIRLVQIVEMLHATSRREFLLFAQNGGR